MQDKQLKEEIKEELREENKKQPQKRRNSLANVMIAEILSLVAGFVILYAITLGGSSLDWWIFERYIDVGVLVLLLVLTLPVLISSGFWKDFVKVFSIHKPEQGWKLYELKRSQDAIEILQKQLLYSAVMIILFQLVNILYTMADPSTLGPGLSHIFMTGLYTAILELLLQPLRIAVKKQITDFMEEC